MRRIDGEWTFPEWLAKLGLERIGRELGGNRGTVRRLVRVAQLGNGFNADRRAHHTAAGGWFDEGSTLRLSVRRTSTSWSRWGSSLL